MQYCWDSEPTQRPTTDFVAMNLDPIANEALDYDFIFHSASRYPAEHDHDRPEKKAAHFHRPTPAYVSDTGFGTGDSTACSPSSPTSFSPFLRQRVGRSPTYDRSNEEAQLPVHETFPASFSPWSHVSSASGSPFSIVSANTSPFSVISPNSGPFIPYHPSQQCPR